MQDVELPRTGGQQLVVAGVLELGVAGLLVDRVPGWVGRRTLQLGQLLQ